MSQTVIGFFDDYADAEKALRQLQSQGIGSNRVDVSRGHKAARGSSTGVNPVSGSERDENTVRRTTDDRTVDPEGRNTNKFTDFFNNLFGGKHDDADRYSRVAQQSEAMVTIHAESRDEAERVAAILDDCGALDVDRHGSHSNSVQTNRTEALRSDDNPGLVGHGGFDPNNRTRSRIFDTRLDEHHRLRGPESESY